MFFRAGDVEIMRELLAAGAETTAEQESGLVSIAAEHNNTEMVKFLYKKYQDGVQSQSGATPFMMAIQEGNAVTMKVLKPDKKIIIKARDNQDRNVLHYALDSRNPTEATQFLRSVLNDVEGSLSIKDLLAIEDSTPEHNTPLHLLAKRNLDIRALNQIFTDLEIDLGSMKSKKKETPLHVAAKQDNRTFIAALLSLDQGDSKIEELLLAKDKDFNTPLHLATKQQRLDPSHCPLLGYIKKRRDPMKFFSLKNRFDGATPFSGAVAAGDTASVEEIFKDLTSSERITLIHQMDGANRSALILAAEKGHTPMFNLLLDNGADITTHGPDRETALEIAIENDHREVIMSIIDSRQWEAAFRMPCKSSEGKLNTPLRMLIRQIPDLAESFLDKCFKRETKDAITMNFDFIDDLEDYKRNESKTEFYHKEDESAKDPTIGLVDHKVAIDNHPLVIMVNEERADLLQHPVCQVYTQRKWKEGSWTYVFLLLSYIAFLALFNAVIFMSENPIRAKQEEHMINNTGHANLFRNNQSYSADEFKLKRPIARQVLNTILLLLLAFLGGRAITFLAFRLTNRQWNKISPDLIFSIVVYTLAIILAVGNLRGDPSTSDIHWEVGAVTISLVWINLLLHMRLLPWIGVYIMIFTDVFLNFLKIAIVFVIMLIGFSLSFHMLLPHRQEFENYYDSLLKSVIMMSGEIFDTPSR